ncbi:MAG: hypothetical protein IIB31_10140 [Chloroflexi bacterium]|nr:hypothetical protein [Chloroflexota bacterium]
MNRFIGLREWCPNNMVLLRPPPLRAPHLGHAMTACHRRRSNNPRTKTRRGWLISNWEPHTMQ